MSLNKDNGTILPSFHNGNVLQLKVQLMLQHTVEIQIKCCRRRVRVRMM